MASAVYLGELIIFIVTFHIVCISHYKSIKSIDDNLYKKIIDVKSKQSCKLSTRYTTEDKRVWRHCNNSYGITESKTDLISLILKQRG